MGTVAFSKCRKLIGQLKSMTWLVSSVSSIYPVDRRCPVILSSCELGGLSLRFADGHLCSTALASS